MTASVENSPHGEAMVLDTERLFGEHMSDVQVFDHINQCIEHLFDYKYFQIIPVVKPESEQQQ